MRCASCGTENAQDSRFCGGCGARIGASGPRVAPTQKISDDAAFPQRPVAPPVAHGGAQANTPRPIPHTPYASTPPPITTQPGVVPQRPLSAPPASYLAPSAPAAMPAPAATPAPSVPPHVPNGAPRVAASRPPTPRLDEPAVSMPMVARRPWALIIVVLIIDIALAGTGAWMLSEGLGDKPAAKAATTPPGAASASGPAGVTATPIAPGPPGAATGGAPAASAPTKTGSNAAAPPPPSSK